MGCGDSLKSGRDENSDVYDYEGPRRRARRESGWALLRLALAVATLAAMAGGAHCLDVMELKYTWGTFDFVYDSPQQMQALLPRGNFTPENSTPFDVDGDHRGRIFMSFAAILPGLSSSLATIADTNKQNSPRLAPYPDWSWHTGQRGCDGLTSVFRIYIEYKRLWVIDSGVVDIGNTFEHKCPAQLFIFDLNNDRLIARHRLPIPPQHNASNLLLNIIVDQAGLLGSNDAYAYIADSGSSTLYVFSLRSGRSWRVESDTFRPDKNAKRMEVNGTTFTLQDGVLGLAQDDKYLYYHSFSSYQEGRVPKRVLRDESLFTGGTNGAVDQFNIIGNRTNQSAGEAMSKDCVMFFAEMGTNSLSCWDSSTTYTRNNHHVVERDDSLMHFVTSVKIVFNYVWAIDNNGQRLFAGVYQPNRPNTVNIMRGPVGTLSSKCRRKIG